MKLDELCCDCDARCAAKENFFAGISIIQNVVRVADTSSCGRAVTSCRTVRLLVTHFTVLAALGTWPVFYYLVRFRAKPRSDQLATMIAVAPLFGVLVCPLFQGAMARPRSHLASATTPKILNPAAGRHASPSDSGPVFTDRACNFRGQLLIGFQSFTSRATIRLLRAWL